MKKRIFIVAGLAIISTICFSNNTTSAWTNCTSVPSNDQYACDMGNIEGLYNDTTALNGVGSNCSTQNGSARSACESGVGSNVYSYLKCSYLATTKAKKVCSYIASNAAGEITSTGSVSTSWSDAKKKAEDKYAGNNSTPSSDTPSSGDGDTSGDGNTSGGDGTIADVNSGSCATILTAFCDDAGNVDIGGLIGLIITIFTGMIVLAGTVGIIVCGFMWMTARDNEAQVDKAKKRMLEVVIGIIAWVLLALLANLFIPKKSTDIEDNIGGDTGIGTITAPVTPPSSGGGGGGGSSTGDDPSTPTTPGDGSWNRLCGPDPSVAIDKSVYGQRTTLYTNKFGRTFYRYQQSDELWSSLPAGTNSEGNQGTLYSRGCYRTSIAVMFNSFGLTDFTPAKLSTESGGMDIDLAMSMYPKSKDYMTATYYSSGKSSWKTKIINAISGGGGVIFLIEKKDGVANDFTTSMHKMPAIDYDSSNGKVFISNTTSTKSGWYDLDYLITSDKVNAVGIVIVMPKDSPLKCKN